MELGDHELKEVRDERRGRLDVRSWREEIERRGEPSALMAAVVVAQRQHEAENLMSIP